MKTIHIILLILLLLLVLLRFNMPSYEGFEDSSKSVTICKADWCGHCKKAAPEFDKLLAASPLTLNDGSKVTVKVLDADQNKEEVSKLKVKGYPTILVKNGANTTEHPGPRTYDAVVQFLNSM
jgi:thiol-disulfide isomerase/thioredoxin